MSAGITSSTVMKAATFFGLPPSFAEITLGLWAKMLEMTCGLVLTGGAVVHRAVLLFVIRILAAKAMAGIRGGWGWEDM